MNESWHTLQKACDIANAPVSAEELAAFEKEYGIAEGGSVAITLKGLSAFQAGASSPADLVCMSEDLRRHPHPHITHDAASHDEASHASAVSLEALPNTLKVTAEGAGEDVGEDEKVALDTGGALMRDKHDDDEDSGVAEVKAAAAADRETQAASQRERAKRDRAREGPVEHELDESCEPHLLSAPPHATRQTAEQIKAGIDASFAEFDALLAQVCWQYISREFIYDMACSYVT